MNWTPYDYESMLIGMVLYFGNDAAKLVFPALTPDRFIYSMNNRMGNYEHRNIWRAIETVYMVDRSAVTIPNVLAHIQDTSEDVRLYLQALVGMIPDRYHIHEIDVDMIRRFAEVVDKVGNIYFLKARAQQIATNLDDQEKFEREALSVTDVDEWANNSLSAFRNTIKTSTGGLQHISKAVGNVKEEMFRKKSGIQTTYLPVGLPSMTAAGMFAAGNLSVLHGKSGGGKSALVHQANLGTAIGLVKNNVQGCVAVFSLEMPRERLILRMASLLAGVDSTFLDKDPAEDPLYDIKYSQLDKWLDYVATLPIYVDHTPWMKTSAMQYATEGLHTSEFGPVRAFSADYVGLFGDDEGDNPEQKLNYIVSQHLVLTRITGANGMIISQTTYPTGGAVLYPTGPGGIRGSQSIGMHADDIYELWNPIYMRAAGIKYAQLDGVSEQHVTIFVEKCRYGSLSPIRLNWNPTCTRFSDPLLSSDEVFDHFKNDTKPQIIRISETSTNEDF